MTNSHISIFKCQSIIRMASVDMIIQKIKNKKNKKIKMKKQKKSVS